jgi:hypothetical protein
MSPPKPYLLPKGIQVTRSDRNFAGSSFLHDSMLYNCSAIYNQDTDCAVPTPHSIFPSLIDSGCVPSPDSILWPLLVLSSMPWSSPNLMRPAYPIPTPLPSGLCYRPMSEPPPQSTLLQPIPVPLYASPASLPRSLHLLSSSPLATVPAPPAGPVPFLFPTSSAFDPAARATSF